MSWLAWGKTDLAIHGNKMADKNQKPCSALKTVDSMGFFFSPHRQTTLEKQRQDYKLLKDKHLSVTAGIWNLPNSTRFLVQMLLNRIKKKKTKQITLNNLVGHTHIQGLPIFQSRQEPNTHAPTGSLKISDRVEILLFLLLQNFLLILLKPELSIVLVYIC